MASRILKTILIGFLSTGVLGSEKFFEVYEQSFKGFLKMRNETLIPEVTPENAREVFRSLQEKIRYEDLVLENLPEKLKNTVLEEKKADENRIDGLYRLFFQFLENQDFCNADLLDVDPSKIQGHEIYEQMRPLHEQYTETSKAIDQKLETLGLGLLDMPSLPSDEKSIEEILRRFDEALNLEITPETPFERHKFERAKERLYNQKWSLIIDKSQELFWGNFYSFSKLLKNLYTLILDEFEKKALRISPLLLGKEIYLPFFFQLIEEDALVRRWIDIIIEHPSLIKSTPLTGQGVVYIGLVGHFMSIIKYLDKWDSIKPFHQRAEQKKSGILGKTIINCNKSMERYDKAIQNEIVQLIAQAKEDLEKGEIDKSWSDLEEKINNIINPGLLKAARWELFSRQGCQLRRNDKCDDATKIYNYLCDDFERSSLREKDKFYNDLFVKNYDILLLFFGMENLRLKLDAWLYHALKIFKNKNEALSQNEKISIALIQLFSGFRGDSKTLNEIKPLYDKVFTNGREPKLEKMIERIKVSMTRVGEETVNSLLEEEEKKIQSETKSSSNKKKKEKKKKKSQNIKNQDENIKQRTIEETLKNQEEIDKIIEEINAISLQKNQSAKDILRMLKLHQILNLIYSTRISFDSEHEGLKTQFTSKYKELTLEEQCDIWQLSALLEEQSPGVPSLFRDDRFSKDVQEASYYILEDNDVMEKLLDIDDTFLESVDRHENQITNDQQNNIEEEGNIDNQFQDNHLGQEPYPRGYPKQWDGYAIRKIFNLFEKDRMFDRLFLHQWMNIIQTLYPDFKDPRNNQYLGHCFSRVVYSLKKLAQKQKKLVDEVLKERPQWLLQWFEETQGVLENLGPRALANSFYSLAKLDIDPSPEWMSELLDALCSHLEKGAFEYPDFTQIHFALQKYSVAPLPEGFQEEMKKAKEKMLSKVAVKEETHLPDTSPQNLTEPLFPLANGFLNVLPSQIYLINGERYILLEGVFYPVYTMGGNQWGILLPNPEWGLVLTPLNIAGVTTVY